MHIFLHSVFVITFWMTFTSAEVKVESRGFGSLDPSLNGMVSDERLLFQATVPSRLACASACLKYDCCVAFSASPKEPASNLMTCRGHGSMSFAQHSTVAVPGSKTYLMERNSVGSCWLERPCTTNSDCPATVANVECFATAGQCLCTPGYYYSFCRDDCVSEWFPFRKYTKDDDENCTYGLHCALTDQQPTFLKYSLYADTGYDFKVYSNCDEEKAKQYCTGFTECRSFDLNFIGNICYLQQTTASDPKTTSQYKSFVDYYQRTCL